MSHTKRYAIAAEACDERNRQDAKWGEQNHPMTPLARRIGSRWISDQKLYNDEANEWKRTNSERVAERNSQGLPSDRNCFWDGIILEEVYEALAETDYAAARAEWIQVIAVGIAIVECLDRQHKVNAV